MKIFYIISSLLVFIPFIAGLMRINRLDKSLKVIFYLVCVAFISNLLMIYFGLVYKDNVWIGHIYTILEFFFIIIFYYKLFERDVFKKIITILIAVFVIIVAFNKIYLESFHKIDNYTLTISSILLLITTSMFLVDFLSRNLIINIKDYRFILTVGFMIYFGGDLFIFALSNDVIGIWIVHNLISNLLMLLYTLVFLWQN